VGKRQGNPHEGSEKEATIKRLRNYRFSTDKRKVKRLKKKEGGKKKGRLRERKRKKIS